MPRNCQVLGACAKSPETGNSKVAKKWKSWNTEKRLEGKGSCTQCLAGLFEFSVQAEVASSDTEGRGRESRCLPCFLKCLPVNIIPGNPGILCMGSEVRLQSLNPNCLRGVGVRSNSSKGILSRDENNTELLEV